MTWVDEGTEYCGSEDEEELLNTQRVQVPTSMGTDKLDSRLKELGNLVRKSSLECRSRFEKYVSGTPRREIVAISVEVHVISKRECSSRVR